MTGKLSRWLGGTAVLSVALGASACAPLGTVWDDVGVPTGRNSYMSGEIRSVDSRASRITLREDRGRNQTLHVDRGTRVVYRQQSYPVSSLQRGDHVQVRVSYDRNGRAWAERIDVRHSTRDRGGHAGRVVRVDGRVSWVDRRHGSFGVSPRQGRSVTVHMPRGTSRSDQVTFQRLSRGDRVRAEVRSLDRDRYELVRFR